VHHFDAEAETLHFEKNHRGKLQLTFLDLGMYLIYDGTTTKFVFINILYFFCSQKKIESHTQNKNPGSATAVWLLERAHEEENKTGDPLIWD
jgi:hypothetical protein